LSVKRPPRGGVFVVPEGGLYIYCTSNTPVFVSSETSSLCPIASSKTSTTSSDMPGRRCP